MSPVLVDTSVWRRFFTGKIAGRDAKALSELLDSGAGLLVLPAVLGELVLGGLSSEQEVLMERLPRAPEISNGELLSFVRERRLVRRGLGWVDAQLLASALVAGALLWSLDKATAKAAAELGASFDAQASEH